MIFYFSGTGNSRFAAESLANLLDDETVSVNHRLEEKGCTFTSPKPFLFVSPTYAWRIPRVFAKWIRENHFSGNSRAYFVMTCGSDIGDAAHSLAALCTAASLQYSGVAAVVMAENYIAMFDTPNKETADRLTNVAGRRLLPAVAKTVLAGGTLIPPDGGPVGWLKSHLINPLFYTFSVRASSFRATEKCIGCGKCAERCPLQNITLAAGKPVWGKECTHCMACICGCPVEAIEYGRVSVGKPRVWNDTPAVSKGTSSDK